MPSGGHNKIEREDLRASIVSLAQEIGDTPTLGQYRERGEYSAKAIYNEFESWNSALEAVELEINELHEKEKVDVECANCGTQLERRPSDVKGTEYCYCNQECHYEHKSERYSGTGNPQSTLEPVECAHCGESILRAKWDRDRRDEFYCSDCWGNVTVSVECSWCGDTKEVWPSLTNVDRHFCTPRCHGRWISENNTGEDHPRWRPGKRPEYYGPNWRSQRRKALIRDQYRCQDCRVTEAEYLEEHGETLSVHHIEPFRSFETDDGWDYTAANEVNNLITVCRQCHMMREMRLESGGGTKKVN